MPSQGENQRQKQKQKQKQVEELLRDVEPHRLASLLRLYGASNICSILQGLPQQQQREKAIKTMLAEAEARDKDPVLGSVGIILNLLDTIHSLQIQIVDAQSKIESIISSDCGGSSSTIYVDDDGQED